MAHPRRSDRRVACAVVTVSDTRTADTDRSGDLLASLLEQHGHRVVSRTIVPDGVEPVRSAVFERVALDDVEAVILTGGTGIAARDRTPEAVESLLDRTLPGFGETFRALSFEEIGPSGLLSRALAGVCAGRIVAALPGSTGAVRLAVERLLGPMLGHAVELLDDARG